LPAAAFAPPRAGLAAVPAAGGCIIAAVKPAKHHPDPRVRALLGLSTCNVSDALDQLGIAGAPCGILPLWPGCPRIAGRAMTMQLVPLSGPGSHEPSPVEGTLRAIGAAAPGDILVIDHGGRTDVNSFGGIAAWSAFHRGLVGVVIDGVTRDVDEMKPAGFPAWGRGVVQQSIRGRCAFGGHGVEVALGGVGVSPGDYLLADDNGVVVIPAGRVDEASALAAARLAAEERIKAAIARGVDPLTAHRQGRYEQEG
jgi:regulator of RNase E activity RraA